MLQNVKLKCCVRLARPLVVESSPKKKKKKQNKTKKKKNNKIRLPFQRVLFSYLIIGQTLLLTLDFVGQEIDAVTNLILVGVNGTDLETFNITQGEGFYQDSYYVTFIPSPDSFRLKVTGFDTSGARFQRVKPTLFTLGDVKLSQNIDNSNSSNAIFPGESLELEINVKNSGDPQVLYFKASDDLKYFNSINPSQASLGKNDSLVLRVSLVAPSDAKYGLTSTVTVFASQDSAFTQLVNFMVLFVTVASKVSELVKTGAAKKKKKMEFSPN